MLSINIFAETVRRYGVDRDIADHFNRQLTDEEQRTRCAISRVLPELGTSPDPKVWEKVVGFNLPGVPTESVIEAVLKARNSKNRRMLPIDTADFSDDWYAHPTSCYDIDAETVMVATTLISELQILQAEGLVTVSFVNPSFTSEVPVRK